MFWGVVVETLCSITLFVFDEGVSRAQQSTIEAQQSKIIALETELVPRTISSEQRDILVKALKGKLDSLPIFTNPKPDQETLQYAIGIGGALNFAFIQAPHMSLTSEFDKVPLPMSGTMLFCRKDEANAHELVNAFIAAGIINSSLSCPPSDSMVGQYAPLPSPALIVLAKPPPLMSMWDDWVTLPPRPAWWVGDWPPKSPWRP